MQTKLLVDPCDVVLMQNAGSKKQSKGLLLMMDLLGLWSKGHILRNYCSYKHSEQIRFVSSDVCHTFFTIQMKLCILW